MIFEDELTFWAFVVLNGKSRFIRNEPVFLEFGCGSPEVLESEPTLCGSCCAKTKKTDLIVLKSVF
jgi:hypothetical protein